MGTVVIILLGWVGVSLVGVGLYVVIREAMRQSLCDWGCAPESSDPRCLLHAEPTLRCSACGSVLVNEDCPRYGNGPEHAPVSVWEQAVIERSGQ